MICRLLVYLFLCIFPLLPVLLPVVLWGKLFTFITITLAGGITVNFFFVVQHTLKNGAEAYSYN